jgi:hypothetical protein
MKAIVKFNVDIEIRIETQKDFLETSTMELDLKASNLGTCLYDTIKHLDTHKLLNNKINSDYKASILDVKPNKSREIKF